MPPLQGDRVVLNESGESRGSRGDCEGCPPVFPASPMHPSTQKSMHAGMQVPPCGISSPTPGVHEHLNLDVYSEVQMLAWPIETQ